MSLTPDQLILTNAIAEYFIRTGKDCTTAELAEILQWKDSKIRRVILTGPGGSLPDVDERTDFVPRTSKDFPGFANGVKRILIYRPTREMLRKIIRAERAIMAGWQDATNAKEKPTP